MTSSETPLCYTDANLLTIYPGSYLGSRMCPAFSCLYYLALISEWSFRKMGWGYFLLLLGFLLKDYSPQEPLCTVGNRWCGKEDSVLTLGKGCGTKKNKGWVVGGRGTVKFVQRTFRRADLSQAIRVPAFPCQFSRVDIHVLHYFSSLVSPPLTSSFLQPPSDF